MGKFTKFATLFLFLILFHTACAPLGRTIVTNPMEATRRGIHRDHPDAFGVRVLGMRSKSESEVAVIYTYNLPPQGDDSGMHFTGVSVYRRIPTGGWRQSGGGGGGSSEPSTLMERHCGKVISLRTRLETRASS